MSDLSIPGVNSNYEKLVEALMKKERIPRDREAEKLEKFKLENDAWRQVNKFSLEVRDIARSLYSFNNPFAEKIVESTNERSITATASRSAKDQSAKLTVVQIAESDKFLSTEIDKNFEIKQGKYTFKVGDKNFSVNWKGGNYKKFIDLVNSRGKDILNLNEIKITPEKKAILFESKITGENNRLEFADNALELALNIGLIKKNDSSGIEATISQKETLPETSQKIPFSQTIRAKDGYTMEIKVLVHNPTLDDEDSKKIDKTENTQIYEQIGSISYKGIVIQNETSQDGLSDNAKITSQSKKESKSTENSDMNILALESARGVQIPIQPLANTDEVQTITIPLSEYGDVKALSVNNNSNKSISIEAIRIYNPEAQGEYIPVKAVSSAKDAIINFEGIQIKRDKNDIEDLIPGVTLHAHESSEKQEQIKIKPDVKAAKDAIIEFIAKYNRLLTEITILTQNQPEVVDEITYFSEDEIEQAKKKLGIMYGDSTLHTLKANLRQIMSMPYKSSDDSKLFMLSQMGISTKSEKTSSIDISRMRGYLEIDEEKLDNALNSDMEAVKLLFGYDSDGDILVDSGLAHSVYEQINPYTQRGGVFGIKTDSLKPKIDSSQTRIDTYDKKLTETEKKLRRKYGLMEGTLKKLNKQSQTIDNFNKQNQPRN